MSARSILVTTRAQPSKPKIRRDPKDPNARSIVLQQKREKKALLYTRRSLCCWYTNTEQHFLIFRELGRRNLRPDRDDWVNWADRTPSHRDRASERARARRFFRSCDDATVVLVGAAAKKLTTQQTIETLSHCGEGEDGVGWGRSESQRTRTIWSLEWWIESCWRVAESRSVVSYEVASRSRFGLSDWVTREWVWREWVLNTKERLGAAMIGRFLFY